jgi:hypothetical protein
MHLGAEGARVLGAKAQGGVGGGGGPKLPGVDAVTGDERRLRVKIIAMKYFIK